MAVSGRSPVACQLVNGEGVSNQRHSLLREDSSATCCRLRRRRVSGQLTSNTGPNPGSSNRAYAGSRRPATSRSLACR